MPPQFFEPECQFYNQKLLLEVPTSDFRAFLFSGISQNDKREFSH